MTCPLNGVPLPYVELKMEGSADCNAKIIFSLETSEALIRYVLAASEPLH